MAVRRLFSAGHHGRRHLCHANMPNVRIATVISRWRHDREAELAADAAGQFAMTDDSAPTPPQRKPLSPAAQRALAEAEARRAAAALTNAQPSTPEFQGPKGPEPIRYGDWENKGIASDF
jgi:hypothetical protein